MQCCSLAPTTRPGPDWGWLGIINEQATCAPSPVPLHSFTRSSASCASAVRVPSQTLAALVISHHLAAPFHRPFSIYLGSRLDQYVLPIRPSRFHTFPPSWATRLPGQGSNAGLLAISPPKRFITLERPVSMAFWLAPCDQWSGDMICQCRCGVAESAADSFWVPSPHPASFTGGFLPGRWRFRALFVTLVGTASHQYNRS